MDGTLENEVTAVIDADPDRLRHRSRTSFHAKELVGYR